MSADTLTPDGAAVVITAPAISGYGSLTAAGFAAIGGAPNELTVAWRSSSGLVAATYDLDGSLVATLPLENNVAFMDPPFIATVSQGGVAIGYNASSGAGLQDARNDYLVIVQPNGASAAGPVQIGTPDHSGWAEVSTDLAGVHVTWIEEYDTSGLYQPHYMQDYSPASTAVAPPSSYAPYADTLLNGVTFRVVDNQAQLLDGSAAVTLPGEPAGNAVWDPVVAGLTNGKAAVAWTDSGSVYLSMYDAATHSISNRLQLDWGASDPNLHLVTLPDGGFALSWDNQGVYKGEVFAADGTGGGIMTLTGQFGGVDSAGDLYTAGVNASGQDVIQTYSINTSSGGTSGGGSSSSISTSASDYTAPDGVTTITLTGSNQTVHANNAGDTIWSNDTGNVLYGGTGNDTFHMGRGGDWAQGGGGSDTFDFAAIPWAAGGITDFGSGDVLDLSSLLATTQDIPAGGFSDGYLKLTDDGSGDTDVWARYATSGANSNWWLVTVLDGITTSSLDAHHTIVTLAPNAGAVTTSASDYVAPSYVTAITLTGSQQHVDASATNGVTIGSNDTGNVLIGGPGPDDFHLGRGGDWVAGGAGADTFAYAATPWAGGGITDFNAAEGDRIDVTGLLAASGYTGSDPFADGYLKYTTDANGNAQLWSDVHQIGNDGWWLVATLDGVSTSSLHYANGLIT